jgi:hypothetical protein
VTLFAENPKRSTLTRTWFDGHWRGTGDAVITGVCGFCPDIERGEQRVTFNSE